MAGRNNHGSYLANLLGDAKKGGFEDEKAKDQHRTPNQPGASLTAEQLTHAHNILGMIGNNTTPQPNQNNRVTDHYHSPDIVVDINGHRHDPDDGPVYYKHKATTTNYLSGVPYAVSDTNIRCNKCTRYRDCDRHRRPHEMKTDISLCKSNHLRLALYWDVSDPENRKKSWSLVIEEKYDRFFNPERERAEHEASARKAKNGDEEDGEDDGEAEGCHPIDPSARIKELVKRIVEDHNRDAKDKARRNYLDPKGREYTTRPHHWGGKDSFVPAAAADTRAGYEWQSSADEGRIERELRVMLQVWYRSKLAREERGQDKTSEEMMDKWRRKMELRAGEEREEMEFNEHGERLGDERVVTRREVQGDTGERYKRTTKEERDAVAKARAKEELEQKREMDKEALSKVTKSTKTTRKPTMKESPARISGSSKATKEAEDLTDERLAGFEQWANEVEAADNGSTAPPENDTNTLKPQPAPAKRNANVATTERERKLLAAMQEKAAEDVQSESEPEPEPEPEDEQEEEGESEESEESSEEEPPAKPKKADTPPKAKQSTAKKTKVATPSPSPKSSAAKSPSPAPKTKPAKPAKPTTPKAPEKRKATSSPPAEKAAPKKSKYKSAAIIIDSDEEADYELPDAPAPAEGLSEQRKGWALAEVVSSESDNVKVVQTDTSDGKGIEEEVEAVVERGTTIVTRVESTKSDELCKSPSPKVASKAGSSPPPEEAESNESMESLFGDGSEEGPLEDDDVPAELEEADEFTLIKPGSPESDTSSLSEPPSSDSEAEEKDNSAAPQQNDDVNDAVHEDPPSTEVDGSDSDSSSLSEPPSFNSDAEDGGKPTSPLHNTAAANPVQDRPDSTRSYRSNSDTSSLSDPPSSPSSPSTGSPASLSRKRKATFSDDGDSQDDAELKKKAKKSVRFDGEVYYEHAQERRMSIEYVLDDDEVEEDEDGKEGEVSE